MLSRFSILNQSLALNPVLIVYGPGMDDTYLKDDVKECNFDQALQVELKQQGFSRVIFLSPHRQLFNPSASEVQSELLTMRESYAADQGENSRMSVLSDGPLGSLKVISPTVRDAVINGDQVMGDVHALLQLDAALRQSDVQTAIVFTQSETTLTRFEDGRTLSSYISEWMHFKTENNNRILFCFSNDTYETLVATGQGQPVPEIRNMIQNRGNISGNQSPLVRIGFPEKDELQHLMTFSSTNYNLEVDLSDLDKFIDWLEAEVLPLRGWLLRFIQAGKVDLPTARQNKWFSADRDPDLSAKQQLEKIVGLETIKKRVEELSSWIEFQAQRPGNSKESAPLLHMLFMGNPGTGKTTVARLMGEMYHEMGILKRGHLVEVTGSDLVGDAVGITALKTNAVVDKALDGVLFIDEAYTLTQSERGGFGQEALDTLISRMENDRSRLVIIFAGYSQPMSNFRKANPGLPRRIPAENCIEFPDYTADELWQIFAQLATERHLSWFANFETELRQVIHYLIENPDDTFGNAGEIRNLMDALERRMAVRLAQSKQEYSTLRLTPDDIPEQYRILSRYNQEELDLCISQIEELVGIAPVKDFLATLLKRTWIERIRKTKDPAYKPCLPVSSLVFIGNPGTGKTTVARLIGKIFKTAGLLRRGHCVETSRADLVAGYVGQTAIKTRQILQAALDGVLFIDEAYSLNRGDQNDFGKEVIDTLVKFISDHPGRLVVILAGYRDETLKLINSNPGLKSRFSHWIDFPDFTDEELGEIFVQAAHKSGYKVSPHLVERAVRTLTMQKQKENEHFGNARSVLSLFDALKNNLAQRIYKKYGPSINPSEIPMDEITSITEEDLMEIN